MKITSELYCLRLNLKLSTRPVTNRNPQNKESRPESGGSLGDGNGTQCAALFTGVLQIRRICNHRARIAGDRT